MIARAAGDRRGAVLAAEQAPLRHRPEPVRAGEPERGVPRRRPAVRLHRGDHPPRRRARAAAWRSTRARAGDGGERRRGTRRPAPRRRRSAVPGDLPLPPVGRVHGGLAAIRRPRAAAADGRRPVAGPRPGRLAGGPGRPSADRRARRVRGRSTRAGSRRAWTTRPQATRAAIAAGNRRVRGPLRARLPHRRCRAGARRDPERADPAAGQHPEEEVRVAAEEHRRITRLRLERSSDEPCACARVRGPAVPRADEILTPDALAFVAELQRGSAPAGTSCSAGGASAARRSPAPAGWTSSPRPGRCGRGLAGGAGPGRPRDRRVEITGPTEPQDGDQRAELRRQGVAGRPRGRQHPALGATSSAARSTCTTPSAGTLAFTSPEGKEYRLRDRRPAGRRSWSRPRGWHLRRAAPAGRRRAGRRRAGRLRAATSSTTRPSCSRRGSGPYFYLPKMESHLEARLWNDVFTYAEERARHPARHDPRHRADRDHPGRVRDGRDPLRAARPRLRAQRRPLGLPVQHHQVLPRRRARSSCCPTAAR